MVHDLGVDCLDGPLRARRTAGSRTIRSVQVPGQEAAVVCASRSLCAPDCCCRSFFARRHRQWWTHWSQSQWDGVGDSDRSCVFQLRRGGPYRWFDLVND